MDEGTVGTHVWCDGTPHPWEFKRVWHLAPSLTDVETIYAGVGDAALFRSTDVATTWQDLSFVDTDTPLSEAIMSGAEPFIIRGELSGGCIICGNPEDVSPSFTSFARDVPQESFP